MNTNQAGSAASDSAKVAAPAAAIGATATEAGGGNGSNVNDADSPVLLTHDGALAIVTMNRPDQHNVLDLPASYALIAVVATLQHKVAAGQVRAVLIRGTGRSFCAGGDIRGFADPDTDLPALLDRMIPLMNQALLSLATLPVPVLSALNGAVGGGGMGLAFCADIVLAAESAAVRGGYSAIGLTPDVGSSWFLVRAIGPQRAKRLLFCNEKLGARQCLDWGLVSEVVPDAELDTHALTLARQLAASATRAIGRTKQLVDAAASRSLAEQLALEHQHMVASGHDPESAEGVAAFIARRPAKFV